MTPPFDSLDLIIPAFDPEAKTSNLVIDIHPGQLRILDYLVASDELPFRNREDVARFAICYGTHILLLQVPNSYALVEAKTNILQWERFQRQKDCLTDSVQKCLARGEHETARRLVTLAYEEYSRIPVEYWRNLWLSTIDPAIELLKRSGIRFVAVDTRRVRAAG